MATKTLVVIRNTEVVVLLKLVWKNMVICLSLFRMVVIVTWSSERGGR